MSSAPGSPDAAPPRRSLIELVTSIPNLVSDLVYREIDLIKAEMTAKLKALGVGAGFLAAAVLLLLALLGVLLTAGILKKGIPPVPTESIDSLKRDLRAIKGIGKRRNP
jgi:hypothetical protein